LVDTFIRPTSGFGTAGGAADIASFWVSAKNDESIVFHMTGLVRDRGRLP